MTTETSATTLEAAIEQAKRAFALEKYEQAVDHYATALELVTQTHGDDAPETADLYFSYGKALLENAISQSSVLGKNEPENGVEEDEPVESNSKNGPILSFSGDADDEGVDLLSAAQNMVDGDDEDEQEGEGDEDAEPEDDFNAAWEVLDLARAIYAKQNEEEPNEDVQLKLADTYIALGDVSLETEKFDQAITDYEAGLELKKDLLPRSSRQIAEAHYKLSMVLDLTSGRLGDAIIQAELALESIHCRMEALTNQPPEGQTPVLAAPDPKGKGKGKATSTRLMRDDIAGLSPAKVEAEMKELAGLKEDLAIKVEELKTRPNEPRKDAPTLAAQVLDAELNNATGTAGGSATVNDLTGMVKKKKKAPIPETASSPAKRKADDEGETSEGKKAKLDE